VNEQETKTKLEDLLKGYYEGNIQYTETKFSNGDGFVEHHLNWIKQHSDDEWEDNVALRRVSQLPDNLS